MQQTETLTNQTTKSEGTEDSGKPQRHKISKSLRNEYIMGWVFVTPLVLGFLLFTIVPFVLALSYSFTEYDLFHAPAWIGFANFAELFTDKYFMRSILNAFIYTLGVPIGAAVALVIAALLSYISRGSLILRMILYLPTICGAVAITFIWQWMYAPTYGILYQLMEGLGMEPIAFLSSEHIMLSMMVMGFWSGLGISVLLFYSSLKNVPRTLYEAAELDGANAVRKFWHITVPGVSPVMFYILITGIVGSFQAFTNFQVMTGDVIGESNVMPVWWIYKFMGSYGYRYGYASALGLVLGFLLIIISAIQFIVSKYWVKYED